jgi:HlyD family secretion protein
MSTKKKILIIGGAVVVVGLIAATLMMDTSNATSVQAGEVERKDISEIVSASGRIQPQTKVDITSEVNGEIVSILAREGDRVAIGDLLVILDTVQLRSNVDQARYAVQETNARLAGMKSALERANEEFEIQTKLFEKNHNTEREFRDAKYAYESADASFKATQAQASQANARLDQQRDYLAKAKIVAPMPGIITYLNCEVGEIAAAQSSFSQGRTLMTISDLDVFEVEVEVDETEINKVVVGQITEIEVDAFPDTTFAGQVVEVGNTAIAGSGEVTSTNFRVKVIFEDPEVQLRPGMSATVDVTTASREDVLSIPYSAVVMRTFDLDSMERARSQEALGESSGVVSEVHAAEADSLSLVDKDDDDVERKELKGVFLIRDGKARFEIITTGIADQKRIEVTSGLQEGDSVIAGPYRVLRTVADDDEIEPEPDRDESD